MLASQAGGAHIAVILLLHYLWAHKQKEAGDLGRAEWAVVERDDEDGKWGETHGRAGQAAQICLLVWFGQCVI